MTKSKKIEARNRNLTTRELAAAVGGTYTSTAGNKSTTTTTLGDILQDIIDNAMGG